jgi:DNA-binding GntR family transcriptional regulator/transposase
VVVHELLEITDRDRVALTKLTASRRTPRGQSTRAHIVLACAEGTVAEAARRCGVSFRTAAKWKQRYERCGIAGLADAPRTGRPAATDEVVHQALTCVLREPKADGWTTRLIADATGLSQSTVCRIRRDHFPKPPFASGPKLAEQSAILAFVYIGPGRRVLAFHSQPTTPDHHRRQSTTRQIADAVETVLCAALVPVTAAPPSRSPTTIELLRRATGDIPSHRSVTVALDFEPENSAKHWLRRNPRIDVDVVPRASWLRQLHTLTEGIDVRQLPELVDLQRQIRDWYLGSDHVFEWSRAAQIFDSNVDREVPIIGVRAERRPSESALVIRALCDAIADGTLNAGQRISERTLAARVQLSLGVVSDALRQLAEDGLVNQDDAGRFVVPAPTERDVLETYTARGLLGAAIVRRLASRAQPLPEVVDDVFKELVWYAGHHDVAVTASLDLDVQDELARAAETSRIEAMFVRLTLQLRLFVTAMGLNYQYPVDEIVTDDARILDAIRDRDPDAAVAAWRRKIDNCVRYMVLHLDGRPRR